MFSKKPQVDVWNERGRRVLAVLACSSLSCLLIAPAYGSSTDATTSLDEVVVSGRSSQLDDLRQEIVQAEDQFYARFNELNQDDRFDVHCTMEAPTGSRLERRYCRAGLETRAFQTEGVRHQQAMQHTYDEQFPQPWNPPEPAAASIQPLRARFRATMLEITRNDAQLIDLLRTRAKLAQRYEQLRKKQGRRAKGE